MNLIYEKEDKTKKLTDEIASDLLGSIVKKYDKWNSNRQTQIDDAKRIREAIYLTKTRSKDVASWKSQAQLPDAYELTQTLKAHLWENIYQNPESMFDVSGKDEQAEQTANTQKSALVEAFENMKIQFELDKCVDNIVEFGDAVIFTGWEEVKKQIRRKKTVQERISDVLSFQSKEKFVIEEKVIFEGAKAKSISPEYFVFDIAKKDNWNSCGKIYKTWLTLDEIEANKVYQLDAEQKSTLKYFKTGEISTDVFDNDKSLDYQHAKKGDQLEILEYWGDIKLTDGTILRNYLITVAARSEIIRFEPNPYVINPFTYCNVIEDPITKRGISPLRVILELLNASTDILNTQVDALKLITNKPFFIPSGALKGTTTVEPGKGIELDFNEMGGLSQPIFMDYSSALVGWEFLNFFKNKIADATGIFPNMSGNTDGIAKTATEVKARVGGQTSRLSMMLDSINQSLIVPMVENVADLIANFKFGEETLMANVKGQRTPLTINDETRQGNYKYIYSDRSAIQDKKNRIGELKDIITSFAQTPIGGQLDWQETFKYALEQFGIENPEQFIKKEEDKPPVQPPTPNAITAELATQFIVSKNLPQDLTGMILSELGLMGGQQIDNGQPSNNPQVMDGIGQLPSVPTGY